MANLTNDKYQEMGFDVKGKAVTDRFGQRYYPKTDLPKEPYTRL